MTDRSVFKLPSLGADMDSGTVLEWLVGPGDTVNRGDTVVVVDTEKSDIEVEIWESGVIAEILVDVGAEVPVGTPLATLVPEGQAPPTEPVEPEAQAGPPTAPPEPAPEPEAPEPRAAPPVTVGPHRSASPLARRLAAEHGVDLATVTGTGPGGAIVRADVEAAAAAAPPATPADKAVDKQEAMRRAIANLMSRSKREIPHYYLADDIDVTAMAEWLERTNEERSVAERVLPAAVLLRATAVAAARHPELNGFWLDDGFQPGDGVHLGVAVSLRGGGLVAPAIHDADHLSVEELMSSLRDLVARARAGRLRGSEMSDSTITVTNLGDRGAALVHGVIYPPQVALVGFGRVDTRPVVADGEIVIGRRVTVTLAADHRATDGERGARFLATLAATLQTPEEL